MTATAVGQERQEAFFARCLAAGRLAHAYLFHGEEGLGKRTFARRLARTVQCARLVAGRGSAVEAPEGSACFPAFGGCGECRSCLQVAAGTHPDCWETGAAGGSVRREQVEEAARFLWLRPVVGARRVVVLADADLLTAEAAAALLKILEEPPSHALVVLVAHAVAAVPVTLRSRCQAVAFRPALPEAVAGLLTARAGLGRDEAVRLAVLAGGRPGAALRLAAEPGWGRIWKEAEDLLAEAEAAAREGPAKVPALAERLVRFLGRTAHEPEMALEVLAVSLRERLVTAPGPGGKGMAADGGLEAAVEALAAVLRARAELQGHANRRLVADVLAWRLTRCLAGEGMDAAQGGSRGCDAAAPGGFAD